MVDIEGLAKPGTREASLLKQIDLRRLPKHVAIIMDGNGRWAEMRQLPRVEGHRAGSDSVREIIEISTRLGLEVLTLFAFSVENWKRPASEIRMLMRLLKDFLHRELRPIKEANIKFQTIGRIHELEESIQKELHKAMLATESNTGMLLNLALNYGGRAELVDTFNRLHSEYGRNGGGFPVDEEMLSKHLYTAGIPDPDLLIRTSGEMRISNFLLWQIAYSEIYITSTYWPDFRRKDFFEAILEYQRRNRRYGGI